MALTHPFHLSAVHTLNLLKPFPIHSDHPAKLAIK